MFSLEAKFVGMHLLKIISNFLIILRNVATNCKEISSEQHMHCIELPAFLIIFNVAHLTFYCN